jgi:hypothetical protein
VAALHSRSDKENKDDDYSMFRSHHSRAFHRIIFTFHFVISTAPLLFFALLEKSDTITSVVVVVVVVAVDDTALHIE